MMLNLLQRGFNPGGNPPPNVANNPFNDPAFIPVAIALGCFVLLFWGVIYTAFIVVLARSMQALKEVRTRNRRMEPGMVWLGLIPVFGSFWTLNVVNKTAEALADEFDDRGMRPKGDNGKAAGSLYAIIVAVCFGLFVAANVPFIGPIFGCVNFVLIIVQIVYGFIYAAKLNAATNRLRRDSAKYDDEDDLDDEFEEDDEPKPRGKPRKQLVDDFEEFDQSKPKPKPKKKPKLDDGFEEYDEPKGGR